MPLPGPAPLFPWRAFWPFPFGVPVQLSQMPSPFASTKLGDVDVPWVADPQCDRPHLRREFLARLSRALEDDQRPYVLVSGGWDERFERAIAAVLECQSRSPRSPRSEP